MANIAIDKGQSICEDDFAEKHDSGYKIACQIKKDRDIVLKSGATSSTHTMSSEQFIALYEKLNLFKLWSSIQISFNKEIKNENEQVVIVIGI